MQRVLSQQTRLSSGGGDGFFLRRLAERAQSVRPPYAFGEEQSRVQGRALKRSRRFFADFSSVARSDFSRMALDDPFEKMEGLDL